MKKSNVKLCLFLSVPFLLSSIGYGSWIINNTKEESIVVSGPKVQDTPVAYIVGSPDVKYTKIEKALDVAKSGDIVMLIPPEKPNYNDQTNPNNPDQVPYEISKKCEIKQGVTLVIPTDKNSVSGITDKNSLDSYIKSQQESKRDQGNSGYGSFATSNSARYLRVTVTVKEGVELINNGTLVISGYLSGGTNGSGVIGQTSHSYSRIVLEKDAKITQNNDSANTYCFGYIDEQSTNNGSFFDLSKGSFYLPLIIYDYRGFTYSYAMTAGAIENERCSAFNDLGFRNISVKTDISYSAKVYGISNVYVRYDSLTVNDNIPNTFGLVGNSSSFLIQQSNSTYSHLLFKCNASDGTMNLDFFGGNTLNNFNLDLELKRQTLSLSTANAFFPISYRFSITFSKATKQTLATYDFSKQRVKLLPGSSFTANDGTTINGNELSVYSSFFDGNNGKGQGTGSCGRPAYPLKPSSKFVAHGNSTLSFNSIGGTVYCDSSSSISCSNKSLICKEPWNWGDNGSLTKPWKIADFLLIKENLQIVPEDYLTKKKIDVGVNSFDSISSFSPSISLETIDSSENISSFQKVIFYDSISSFSIGFIKDIYQVFYNGSFYEMGSSKNFQNIENIVSVTSSNLSISNNNAGVNEFEVREVHIIGDTHELIKDTVLQLDKQIIDADKSYTKTFNWSSLDESVATVDQNGLVKGVGLGITSIKLESGGKEDLFEINVVAPSSSIEGASSVEISSENGTKDGGTFEDGVYVFNAKIIGENGSELSIDDITSIKWTIKPEAAGRAYLNGDKNLTEVSGSIRVTANINGGEKASSSWPFSVDNVYLTCEVVDKKGNVVSCKFHIVNDNACLLPTAKVLMAGGSYKPAGDIRAGDIVMSFNHESGRLEPNVVIGNDDIYKEPTYYDVVHLVFENGNQTDFIYEHGYFDLTLNKYVYMHDNDVNKYIGHDFVCFDKNGNYQQTKLVAFEIKRMYTSLASPATANRLNLIVDDMLSIGGGLSGLFNIFEYDRQTLAFDKTLMQKDIDKYGLLGYECFEKYFPKEIYDLLPCKYLGVSIGKGLITWDIFEGYVNKWKDQLMENVK